MGVLMPGADRSKKSVLGHIQAQHYFRQGLSPNVISFNTLCTAFLHNDHFLEVAKLHVKDGHSQDFANTAWAFADLTKTRLKNVNSQCFGNSVWAFAKADHASLIRFDAIAQEIQGLGNIMWAFAKAVHASLARFDAIAHEVKLLVKDLDSQQLASIVCAFAIVNHASTVLLDAITEVAKTCFKDLLKDMRKESSSPDVICFNAAISACEK
eukprot:12426437-Karenia_brevis.AAC.1